MAEQKSFLNTLRPAKGSTHVSKRRGRGESSGLGKTAGRGHKGQKARAGGFHKVGFEGGQMPLARRLPKRGFFNFTRKEFVVVNVGDLSKFSSQSEINPDFLKEQGAVKKIGDGLKILGDGEIKVALTVKAHRFSESARQKIEKAGGKAVLIN